MLLWKLSMNGLYALTEYKCLGDMCLDASCKTREN